MKKSEMIERYRNGYANDSHLNTAVAQGILTTEEAESLKSERYHEGRIVKREEFEHLRIQLRKMEEMAMESDTAILALMDALVELKGDAENV